MNPTIDINTLHRKLAPTKFLGNFYKSEDFKTVEALLAEQGVAATQKKAAPHRGSPACTLVHPLVALSFLRWADQTRFYAKLNKFFVAP